MLPILLNDDKQVAISSVDLRNTINELRLAAGESEIRLDQFNAKIEDELEGVSLQKNSVTNNNGTVSKSYLLDLDQCMLVSMRESKGVRRAMLAKLKDQETVIKTLLENADVIALVEYPRVCQLLADLTSSKAAASNMMKATVRQ